MKKASMQKRIKGKRSQALGVTAEKTAAIVLRMAGFKMVERIHTGTKNVGGQQVFVKRVNGDFYAIAPDGRSTLIEVKKRDDRLVMSDFKKHQVQKLEEHHQNDGLSIVVWVHSRGVSVLRWPVIGLEPGKGIGIDDAERQIYHTSIDDTYITILDALKALSLGRTDDAEYLLIGLSQTRPFLRSLIEEQLGFDSEGDQ